MSEWKIEGKRQMLAEATVALLSLPWCKSGCWSPEYRWHYTSNPLNGWDTLTCWCLEWPASISSASAMPNTFVNATAKSPGLGYGSEGITFHLILTLASTVNVLHWFFCLLWCKCEAGMNSNVQIEATLQSFLRVVHTEESMPNGKYCLDAQSS